MSGVLAVQYLPIVHLYKVCVVMDRLGAEAATKSLYGISGKAITDAVQSPKASTTLHATATLLLQAHLSGGGHKDV